ncbi:hypothetical protein EXN66_Car019476 [Channa argus]|uniref:Uncharacterized protein n=1 Tax=Channa argus TaxID=215402 RepID=A0A6G1QNI0_CHAAH|nr:hypothetical protein EXN66_Car019476 [Channa argus]
MKRVLLLPMCLTVGAFYIHICYLLDLQSPETCLSTGTSDLLPFPASTFLFLSLTVCQLQLPHPYKPGFDLFGH